MLLCRRLGNGINWKSQVYPALRNYDADSPVSGITNILKRHYQVAGSTACTGRPNLCWHCGLGSASIHGQLFAYAVGC